MKLDLTSSKLKVSIKAVNSRPLSPISKISTISKPKNSLNPTSLPSWGAFKRTHLDYACVKRTELSNKPKNRSSSVDGRKN